MHFKVRCFQLFPFHLNRTFRFRAFSKALAITANEVCLGYTVIAGKCRTIRKKLNPCDVIAALAVFIIRCDVFI